MLEGLAFREAKRYLAGGVNSPVRAFKAVGGGPIFIKKGKGARIFSEDGRQFLDYCLGFGALILGHAHIKLIQGLKSRIGEGTVFGAPTKEEIELAKLITRAIPSIDKVRLTNSGTEAAMTAIRLARGYTGRNKIIKFEGSYHGHADYLLDCPGVPDDFKKYTLTVPYNNIEMLRDAVNKNKTDLAAIIVEPVAGNMGVVLPKDGFLECLRKITYENKIILIFDEVITGFRFCFGGAQNLLGLKPDLTCLGKIIGGGLPIGAVGGRGDIMRLLAPEGSVYQAGTFSGNPLSVKAGLITLGLLLELKPYKQLEEAVRNLCGYIRDSAKDFNLSIKVNYFGPIFSVFFTDKEVVDYRSAKTQDTGLFRKFYQGLLKEGIYFAPSAFEADFLSVAHTEKDIEKTKKAAYNSFKALI